MTVLLTTMDPRPEIESYSDELDALLPDAATFSLMESDRGIVLETSIRFVFPLGSDMKNIPPAMIVANAIRSGMFATLDGLFRD